jgi:hypothetical protein
MAWTDGVDKSTGDTVTAAIWNGYLGTAGSIQKTAPAVVTTAGDTIHATGDNVIARLGIGSEGQVYSVSSGGVPEWATAAGGSWTYEGGTTTPFTTSSTIVVAAATITGLSIAASKPIVVMCSWKGGSGAASNKTGGLWKYNTVEVNASLRDIAKDGDNTSEGFQTTFMGPRISGYEMGGWTGTAGAYGSLDKWQSGLQGATNLDNVDFTETITDIVIGVKTTHTSGSATLGFVAVYSLAVS